MIGVEKHPAEVLADQLRERFGATVPTSQAAAMLRTMPGLEAERDALRGQLASLRENFQFVLCHCREAQTLAIERQAEVAALRELLDRAESSLTDYRQDVPFGDYDAQTLSALRAAISAARNTTQQGSAA